MEKRACAFTGHRPQKLPFRSRESDPRCVALKARLEEEIVRLIEEKGVTHFISGMALGIDTYAAEIVLRLKSRYPELTLEAAIPCPNQTARWRQPDIDRYNALMQQCDKLTLISERYTKTCMHERNHYMVDSADYLIAVWDNTPSGTGKTVEYARANGIEPVIIVP